MPEGTPDEGLVVFIKGTVTGDTVKAQIIKRTKSFLVGKLMQFPKKDIVALNMTTLARNSPLSLAIAVVTFPEQPLISLALVIGPLIELPVLSVISGILKKWNTEE